MGIKLKPIDYEIFRQIKEYRNKGLKIFNRHFDSSTKISRIKLLKAEGYIKKHGKERGRGTLSLTEIGEAILNKIPSYIEKSYKMNGKPRYIIKIETLSGPKINFETEISRDQSEILGALSYALSSMRKKNGVKT